MPPVGELLALNCPGSFNSPSSSWEGVACRDGALRGRVGALEGAAAAVALSAHLDGRRRLPPPCAAVPGCVDPGAGDGDFLLADLRA